MASCTSLETAPTPYFTPNKVLSKLKKAWAKNPLSSELRILALKTNGKVVPLKVKFADPISDQLFEALYFAAKFGSRNTIKVLRELSEYVSADLSVRAEINTRFGWIKNSANLAALAPWLLFLILRTQINAKVAYEQPFGQFLMAIGVLATLIAYYWMNRIANLPKAKRIFTLALGEK